MTLLNYCDILYTINKRNKRKDGIEIKDLSEYRILNKANLYREFKEKYHHPEMYLTSYRRVLYGESTYLKKGRSPYITDMFLFFSEKLDKPFLDVAFDLLDSEFFGKKNTLYDVIVAELKVNEDDESILEDLAKPLANIRLCDLNDDNRKIYESIKAKFKSKKEKS